MLTEALARDFNRRDSGTTLADARKRSGTLVKLVHEFTREGLTGSVGLELPRVAIFDEGQRVWDAKQMSKKHDFGDAIASSEPEVILLNLEKQDWSVVVVLVGDGQEIHTGETGVKLWIEAAEARRRSGGARWRVSGSRNIPMQNLLDEKPSVLFLGHSRRSHNAAWLASWVEAIMEGDAVKALSTMTSSGYAIRITRDLDLSRSWLRDMSDRSRCGLVASAHAERLRPYGIEMDSEFQAGIDWRNWFLDRPPSLESSSALEVAASEFKCQGLELDFVGVCWSWDLVRPQVGWEVRRIERRKLRWRVVDGDLRRFQINAYRVLMTRARAGMILWIPRGDMNDPTRNPKEMDDVFEFLVACGAVPLH